MEGLIPLVYKAIVQYRDGSQASMAGSWFNGTTSSPSASYMRLPGDSGRYQTSEIQLFGDRVLSVSSPPSMATSRPQSRRIAA